MSTMLDRPFSDDERARIAATPSVGPAQWTSGYEQPDVPPTPTTVERLRELEAETTNAAAKALVELSWRTLADIDDSPPQPLLFGLLEPDGPTLMYAAAGVGKGTTGAWLIGQAQANGRKVLIYDAERRERECCRPRP